MHDEYGWYIGPDLQHYRCYHCYCTITNNPHTIYTVEFFPTEVELTHPSSVDVGTQAALDLS